MFRRALLALALLVCAVPAAGAQESAAPLDGLVDEVLARNPEVAAARARYAAASLRPAQERSLPDPMVSLGYRAAGRPYPGAGLGTEPNANIGAMVSQEIPYPGKLQLRADMVHLEATAALQDVEAARLAVVSRLKQAYYRLGYTRAATDVLVRNRALLETLLAVTESRYAVGSAAQQDVFRAQTELSLLELRLERLAQERLAREGEINALRDRPAGTPVARPHEPALVALSQTLHDLVAMAWDRAPTLRRERAMVERADVALESARLDFKPDFALSGGYFYSGSMPAMYELRLDVALPLRRSRRTAAVAERQQDAAAARASVEAARLSLQAAVQEDFQTVAAAYRLAVLYRETVLPQARLALESSLASYQTGALEFQSVLANFTGILQIEMAYFEELAALHAALSRLEELTGTALVP